MSGVPCSDPLRVCVLGPVRAWLGDRELALGAARQRALFAVLAAAAGRAVGRDELIESVWGSSPPATAVGNIYTYVSGLRRGLGRELLTSGPAGYALRLSPGDLDSERFAGLLVEATELCDAADPAGAVARLDEALGLWRGEAYAGLTGHRIEMERARLAARRLAAVELHARVLTELGDDGVVAELSGLVRSHPLHEPLHELLILALHRAGRRDEALAAYRAARHTFRSELGVEPGPALTELYQRVRAAPAGNGERREPGQPSPATLTDGRDGELERLRSLLRALVAGQGAAVWIEGEPGIGKTELLAAAFAGAGGQGCQVAWSVAGDPDRHVPLQVVARALGVEAGSADCLLAYVSATCAIAPLVLIVDDMQRADADSMLLWDRLVAAARRMPLLLVAAARPVPHGPEVARLRRGVLARQGHLLRLAALAPEAIERLVVRLAGAPLGPNLAAVVSMSGGNPLCAREMTTELLRRGAVRVAGGVADIAASVPVEAPPALLAVVRATADLLSDGAREVLRTAALLGTRFAADEVGAVTGRPPFDVVSSLEEALAAEIVVDAGTELAFRHPFLRQALYESIPAADRVALHRHTAEMLDGRNGPVIRVAEQLAAAAPAVDDWVVSWLVAHHAELVRRAPGLAGGLLRRALDAGLPDLRQREHLLIALVKLDFRGDGRPLREAREAAELASDPGDRAEMRHLLAAMTYRSGDTAAAIGVVEDSLADPAVPDVWRTRHRALLAGFRRGPLDDLDRADRTAEAIHAEALAADQPFEAAYALQTRWLTNSIRRDHERALQYADRALDIMRENRAFAGMYLDLLDNRTFTLQNLDRLAEADGALREASLVAIRHRLPSGLPVASAMYHYWVGRWDDALAEVSALTDDAPGITFLGVREPGAIRILLHGVAALIAAQRDDAVLAGGHLDAAEMRPSGETERESSDFLLVARALLAERQGRPQDALRVLRPLLAPEYAPLMLRHQWLPGVTRLALSVGRRDVAERAAAVCAREAAKEVVPARAHSASARCRALLTGDPEPALGAVAHYREVGRVVELAAALEDAAVLLAANRRPHEAARTGAEAAELYDVFGARWDRRRARRRLAEYGVDPCRGPVGSAAQRTSSSYSEQP